MPFCPKCKYEYRKGMKVCPDCDVQLEDKLHEEPKSPEPNNDDSWVPITSGSNKVELDLIQGILESAGIPTILESNVTTIYPTTLIDAFTGTAKLCVPASKMEEAEAVMREAL